MSDSICESSQSRWYKVAIHPGQRVTAEVDAPPFDITLAMFKDIQAEANDLSNMQDSLSLQDVQNVTAQLPREEFAPDATSADATSPDATSPDATSPDATSPDLTSPDATSPDATSPDATSPDATSPDSTSPDRNITEQTYLAAQSATLLAYSDKPGTSTELVQRNTWDNEGDFYIRVRGHNGAFDATNKFTLKVIVDSVRCSDAQLTSVKPSTLENLPATPRTLILTNSGRFPDGNNTIELLDRLHAFAARQDIGGRVVDLKDDAGLGADYAQWNAHPECVQAANIVVDEIHAIEQALHKQSPKKLQYVVLVGSDKVIPFRRIPDEAGLGDEQDYDPAVKESSESAASLELGYFLSQDIYGSFSHQVSLGDHEFSLFDIPVGRLVENVPEIETMLSAYEDKDGQIEPSNALVAGYDFMSSATTREFNDLQESGVAVDPLIEPDDRTPDSTKGWSADALRQPLLKWTQHYDIIDLNAHFSGNTLLAADEQSRIKSSELKGITDQRFMNSIVMSMGCHSGYNIVDGDATHDTQPIDWAQAFAMKGATLVGGTGYQYGNYPFIKYSTQLLSDLTYQLRLYDGPQPEPIALGDAIVDVKRDYVRGGLNGIDEKAVSELTLYGLPMMKVNLRDQRILRPQRTQLTGLMPAGSRQLSFKDVKSDYQLVAPPPLELDVVDSTGTKVGTTSESYFVANYSDIDGRKKGDVQTNPAQLVLPRVLKDVQAPDADGNKTLARGVILWKATYTDVGGGTYRPLIDDPAVTERRGIRPPFASSVFTPTQIVRLSDLAGQTLVELPLQFQSKDDNSVFGTARRYDAMTARVYYSSRMDASALLGPPIIYSTTLSAGPDHRHVLVDVKVGGAPNSDIEQVLATYTWGPNPGTNQGQWKSVALNNGENKRDAHGFFARHYTHEIPTDGDGASIDSLRVFIQAVGGNGLVTTETNNGRFYQLSDFPAAAAIQAKHATSLTLQLPAADAVYRSMLPVQATLLDSTTQAPIPNKRVSFSLGAALAQATTGPDGVASAKLPVRVTPDSTAVVTASFVEDDAFKPTEGHQRVNVTPAATHFMQTSIASIPSGGAGAVAVLFRATDSSPNVPLSHVPVTIQLSAGNVLHTQTDVFGRILFDTTDVSSPGTYSVTLTYAPKRDDLRYLGTTISFSVTVT